MKQKINQKKKVVPFKQKFFVCPIGKYTSRSLALHPSLIHEDPLLMTECYFGDNPVRLSVYEIDERLVNSLKKDREFSFYLFTQKTKEGNKQYFYSQNVKPAKNDGFAKMMNDLLQKITEIKKEDLKETVVS